MSTNFIPPGVNKAVPTPDVSPFALAASISACESHTPSVLKPKNCTNGLSIISEKKKGTTVEIQVPIINKLSATVA